MNVMIPLGGKGERFRNQDYKTPKVLVPVLGKEIIFWVLESLKLTTNDYVTIIYNNELEAYQFEDRIRKKFSYKFNFIKLPFQTGGPVETILYGLNKLPKEILKEQLLIHDGDSFGKKNILEVIKTGENKIFYSINENPKPLFSYIVLNEHGEVVDIAEKKKISDNANIGCYVFDNAETFIKYGEQLSANNGEIYISHIYGKMLKDNIKIYSAKVASDDFICLGTPEQVVHYSTTHSTKPLKFCVDLDNTLVTFPRVKNDYTTVEPIENNIKFLRYLKSKGHYIIIYTARRMLTHTGNVGKIIKDVGKITLDTLEKFDIPYDEIVFGKPHADFYIDDLAVNPFDNLEKNTGFYINVVEPREFNDVQIKETSIVKTSEKDMSGEIYFYQHYPARLSGYFPKLIVANGNSLEIEKVDGNLLSKIYCHKLLQPKHIDLLWGAIGDIHSSEVDENDVSDIYNNYSDKLAVRYRWFDYSSFPNHKPVFDKINKALLEYEEHRLGIKSIIHGDLVFSNVFIIDDNNLKFIDMRGKLGNVLSIYGDKFYDYAKMYQSLIGYDFILNGMAPTFFYIQKNVDYFEKKFLEKFGQEQYRYLKYLTASLLFSLIPLHNNDKCKNYYNLIEYLI